ncbi:uncharacterized protein LOC110711953 [Chenopodium quinoa]|uniref:uncharacterized protein LOC110711953 n=1 Tax=Chenopodium quinoa TaxID=63459 RepID=UPI000B795615|nr:uncharacterized protein LOC110711953 [Chenopodium quinoa]
MHCNWRLHASILPDGRTWAIKSIQDDEHTCQGLETKNPIVNVKWAMKVHMEDIRANNDIFAKSLNQLLWSRYGIQMYQSTLYRMRTKALVEIHGGHDVSYSYLPKYVEAIKVTNPNFTAICALFAKDHLERPLAFSSIFISFKAYVDGLMSGCRSLIGLDGAYLKGNYGGVLLSAIALDGNKELFPIAWAIVPSEDTESWKFFIWHLKNFVKDSGRGDEWCIISDSQKGMDIALTELWPKSGRRKHVVHTTHLHFRKAMEALQKANSDSLIWLSKVGEQSTWSKHAFNPAIKLDVNKSNFVESFNATLGVARCRPILTLLEGIRRVIMVRMATRRDLSKLGKK